jgi:hypothetical protein
MERERGLEPPASSLGMGTSIEDKEHGVFVGFILAIEVMEFSSSVVPPSLIVLN